MQSTEGFNPYKFGFGADVVWAGDRKPDRWTGRIPPIGRTVDVDNATYTNTIGAVELKTVWTDPEFDPGRDAFYYARVLEIPTPRWTTIQAKQPGIAPPDVVAATVQERAWASPIWYTPSAEARKSAKPGTTVADLKKQGAVPLDDAQLRALIVGKSPFVENTVTGEKYQVTYSASGKAPAAKPATPVEPGCVTQQFAANQGQVQIQHVGRRFTEPSLVGDVAESSYLGASRGYYINNGKIVTALVGTPIEMAVYKLGDSYFGARSNEFGVRTEILYREALALGLDKDDTIVKRRMAQKMDFLFEDVAALRKPTTDELRAWFEKNAERFTVPAYGDRAPEDVAKTFGPGFARAFFEVAPGAWTGPIESGYGWHLVWIDALTPARPGMSRGARCGGYWLSLPQAKRPPVSPWRSILPSSAGCSSVPTLRRGAGDESSGRHRTARAGTGVLAGPRPGRQQASGPPGDVDLHRAGDTLSPLPRGQGRMGRSPAVAGHGASRGTHRVVLRRSPPAGRTRACLKREKTGAGRDGLRSGLVMDSVDGVASMASNGKTTVRARPRQGGTPTGPARSPRRMARAGNVLEG